MIITPTAVDGVWLIEPVRRSDERGSFERSFCAETFARHGLPRSFVQCSLSTNTRRGTLRGLHWQDDEGKLVRCVRGAVFDVAVDMRPQSPTRLNSVSAILSAENGKALYIAPGVAHGFEALCDGSDVFYMMTTSYAPDHAHGVRWDDPALAIPWPLADPILSSRDAGYADIACL